MIVYFFIKMWLMRFRRSSLFLLLTNFFLAAGSGSFTWTSPPPAWTPTNAEDVRTFNFTVLDGRTNVALRWNYTLGSGENLGLTQWKMGESDLGFLTSVPVVYDNRFIISTSEVATLIIKNVSDISDATFECKVQTSVGSWKYNIRVEITAPPVISGILGELTVNESNSVNLTCKAGGKPKPDITWIRVADNRSVTFPFTIDGKQDEGLYRCTADNDIGNPVSRDVFITVQYYRPINTSLDTNLKNNTVVLNATIKITCRAQANPPAKYQFYKNLVSFRNDTNGSDVSVITIPVSERIKHMHYSCTPFNDFGAGPPKMIKVTVLYAPDATTLTTVPSNRTLLRGNIMSLNCETNASPEAEYYFYFNGKSIGKSTSGVLNVTVEADGVYTCVPNNTVGRGDIATVDVTAVVAPSVEISKETAIVVEGQGLVLTCNATGKPEPNVTWTKVGGSKILSNTSFVRLTIVNVSRPGTPDNMIQYQCTASNGVGTPATATSTINVYYGASVSNPGNESFNVEPGMEVNFLCLGMGNPTPTVNWTSADGVINWMSNLSNVTFTAEAYSSGSYLCTIKNDFGEAFKRFDVDVVTMHPLIKATVTNRGRDDNLLEICKQVAKMVNGHIKREDRLARYFKTSEVEKCEPGSVTAYLSLDFTQNVKITDVLRVLKNAAEGNGFGDFQVNPGSIQAISEEQLPTDPPSTTVGTTTSEDDKDKDKGMLWIIIGASVGGAIVLIIVVAVVTWCVHHKRKCRRKGSKVRCSESEAFAPEEDNGCGHVNNGYADKGPRPTEMEDMSQHQGASAVPTYAVVDKSAKKASKKDKKVEEEKPQAALPEYAAVDKSKKKKKEEPEATYAEVDKSKKSKKQKPKPGEVLYADLNDFHQMQELPAVSTSPQALPPIKKPTPYVETQYADITQFLKGDATLPESNNSQGPGTGTQAPPAPENSNNQEPGTSTKETSQASNPGGDGGPGHETNF